MSAPGRDEGFIVVDALAGAVVLALAGTVGLIIASTAIDRSADDLDRSVALLTLDGLAAELSLAGAAAASASFPYEQDGMRFELAENVQTRQLTLSATRPGADEPPLATLDVARPIARPGSAFP